MIRMMVTPEYDQADWIANPLLQKEADNRYIDQKPYDIDMPKTVLMNSTDSRRTPLIFGSPMREFSI